MKYKNINLFILTLLAIIITSQFNACQTNNLGVSKSENVSVPRGAYYTGEYQNLFKDLLNKSETEINSKIEKTYNQLFYGNDSTQRIFYPVGDDMGYIKDINNNDIRTEGMSYGMMITVQLNKKIEFDEIWKWAKKYMQFNDGPHKRYFAWHCNDEGKKLSTSTASDGEEWFVTALFFASARWGDGEGIFNYSSEAQQILDAMLTKVENSDDPKVITNMFNRKEKMVVFVPNGDADNFTDPSYHVPHFYELWARWANKENQFWCDVASTSREYFKKTVNQKTGLVPDYSNFDGTPLDKWGGGHENFQFDAWRFAMNVAVDYDWFRKDKWAIEQSNRLLNFFYLQGISDYGNTFTLDGKQLTDNHSTGLVAMNAVASLASTNENRKEFVQALWNVEIPDGHYRYYDSMLYMFGLLQVSGNFKIYRLSDITNKCD